MTGKPPDVRVLLSTCPPPVAELLATTLVESRHAACVSIIDGVRSVYRWQGAIEKAGESLLIIKCPAERVGDVREALVAAHPYDVPEVIVLPVEGGNRAYLEWVVAECDRAV